MKVVFSVNERNIKGLFRKNSSILIKILLLYNKKEKYILCCFNSNDAKGKGNKMKKQKCHITWEKLLKNTKMVTLKISATILVIVILLLGILINSYATEKIEVNVKTTPNIDIVLTKSKTSTDLTNFEEDLKVILKEKGVDTSKIVFQTATAEEVSTSSKDINFVEATKSWKAVGEKAWKVNNNGQIYLDLTAGTSSHSSSWTPQQNYNSCKPGWYGEALINDSEDALRNINIDLHTQMSKKLNHDKLI